MKTLLSNLMGKFTMYQTMLWFLRMLIGAAIVLSFFGALPYTWWHLAVNLLLFLVFCLLSNLVMSKLYKVKSNFESQYITGEILTLIVGPLNPMQDWWIIAVISFLAMASKYVFTYGKRHIFNPAAFGALTGALILGQGASWWIGGRYMLGFVIFGGLVMLYKLRWFHLTFSFLLTYLIALSITLFAQGTSPGLIFGALKSTVLDSGLIFFTTVMLIEPLTAPNGKRSRIIYGIVIGLFMVLIPVVQPTYGYAIETALLAGNLLMFILAPKQPRQTLTLVEKKLEAQDTYSFWFQPESPIKHKAGQFQEWSLPHPSPDNRGVRRFFTIASSPGQQRVRLVTKFNPKSSTFKQQLQKLQIGDTLTVSEVDGSFILPANESQKIAFVAGGVGITPFLSIFQDLIDKNLQRDIAMYYANKTPAEVGFRDLIERAQKQGLNKAVLIVNKADNTWTGPTGYITADLIKKETPDWQERLWYLSGPEPMVMAYEKMLAEMGVPKRLVKHDYFPGYTL